ncbi:MAG: ribosome silencing factor [Candidatus Eutrophobiaceae bacterium]
MTTAHSNLDSSDLLDFCQRVLDDNKAMDIIAIDVRDRTILTDWMVIASGTSRRHVKGIFAKLVEEMKKKGYPPMGIEGEPEWEWALVDGGDIIIHVMCSETREYYQLEKLWGM